MSFLRGQKQSTYLLSHMEISTMLTPCLIQGCVQGCSNLENTMELQCFPPCYRVVNALYQSLKIVLIM